MKDTARESKLCRGTECVSPYEILISSYCVVMLAKKSKMLFTVYQLVATLFSCVLVSAWLWVFLMVLDGFVKT